MKLIVKLLLTLPSAVSAAKTDASGAGLAKVIQMLTDMTAAAKTEMHDEEVAFATFSTWCQEESSSLKKEIASDAEEIESLAANEGKLRSDAETLAGEIAELNANVERFETERKGHDDQRDKDNKEFLAVSQDHSESVDALDRALVHLQKQSYDRPAALAQLSSTVRHRAMSALKARSEDPSAEDGYAKKGLEYDAPEANAYEFQSGGIVGVLKNLKDEFRTKLGEAQKAEMNSKHAHSMIVQDLVDSTKSAKNDISEKSADKERKLGAAAADEKKRTGTEAVNAENEKTLSEMTAECTEKTESYKEKQQR